MILCVVVKPSASVKIRKYMPGFKLARSIRLLYIFLKDNILEPVILIISALTKIVQHQIAALTLNLRPHWKNLKK